MSVFGSNPASSSLCDLEQVSGILWTSFSYYDMSIYTSACDGLGVTSKLHKLHECPRHNLFLSLVHIPLLFAQLIKIKAIFSW